MAARFETSRASPIPSNSDLGEHHETETLWQTVKGDFVAASGLKLIGVVALILWMAFQWGPGNDIVLPSVVAWAYDAIDDQSSWTRGVLGALAAGLAAFVFWGVSQILDAIVTVSGLKLVPGISRRVSRFLRRKDWVTPYADMRWSTRWAIAYATGVSALCLVDVFATGVDGVRIRRRMIGAATLLSAGTVGLISTAVAAAAMVAVRIPATKSGADTFIRYAKNPLTWIVIIGVAVGVGHLRSKRTASNGST